MGRPRKSEEPPTELEVYIKERGFNIPSLTAACGMNQNGERTIHRVLTGELKFTPKWLKILEKGLGEPAENFANSVVLGEMIVTIAEYRLLEILRKLPPQVRTDYCASSIAACQSWLDRNTREEQETAVS